jgi:transcription elongation GreA/GreB family factor
MMNLKHYGPGDAIEPGALVEVEPLEAKRRSRYLVVPRGGGTTLSQGSLSVLVIAPQSPLGEALVGRRAGEEFEVETQGAVREYRVVSVL